MAESSSGLSSVKLSLSKTSTTVRSSQAAEIQPKMTSVEITAKQLALEEQRRMEEFEKQLKVKRKLELFFSKTKLKDSNSKLKKEERLGKLRTRLHGSQQKQQSLKTAKMKIMTLKLCLIDCLILQMNLWRLNIQMLWWETYP